MAFRTEFVGGLVLAFNSGVSDVNQKAMVGADWAWLIDCHSQVIVCFGPFLTLLTSRSLFSQKIGPPDMGFPDNTTLFNLEPLPVTSSTPQPSLTPLKSPTKLPMLPSSAVKMPPPSTSASSKALLKPTCLTLCDVSIVRSTRSTTPRSATLEQDHPSITVLAQSLVKRKAEDLPVGPISLPFLLTYLIHGYF